MSQQQIRMATEADRPALEALWDYCFNDGETFRRWYFSQYYRREECIVGCDGEMVAASLQVIDLPTRLGDAPLRAGYIVGVDCLPEYRGMGFTRRLMAEAIDHYAPAHDLQLLHLMPFEADFYEPYGFVYSDYHFQMDIDITEFYRAEDRALAHRYHWQALDMDRLEETVPILEGVYARCTARYDLCVGRQGMRRWRALCDDLAMEGGHLRLLYDEAGAAVGYIAYMLRDGALFVREAMAQDGTARRALYYFIASHRSQVKRVEWSAPSDEAVVFQRRKDKGGVRYQPFMMNLILDPTIIAGFATALPTQALRFSVAGCGHFLWLAGSAQIERLDEAAETALTMDRRTLSQMVFDRSWEAPAGEAWAQMAALFTKKPMIFNNEYF